MELSQLELGTVSQSEQAAGPADEETSKQSEQNKVCVLQIITNYNYNII